MSNIEHSVTPWPREQWWCVACDEAAVEDPCQFCGESVERTKVVPAEQLRGAVNLLRWALPYLPEPLPSMEGGAYAENYNRAMTLAANTPTGGQYEGKARHP